MRVSTTVVHVPWRAPLASAHAHADAGAGADADAAPEPRPLVLLELTAADGVSGHGEAAPLESYDGVSLAAVLGALEACRPVLEAADDGDPVAPLQRCREVTDLPQALAAVDLALWDLAGRRAGLPVSHLLGAAGKPVRATVINAVVGASEPTTAAHEAAAAVRAGFRCVKVKVGAGDDLARVRAVRAAVGADVALRIDANGAWANPEDAVAALTGLAEFDIELCEEPVHGAAGLAAVAATSPVRVAIDESVRDPGVFDAQLTDLVCLKIAASGGMSGLLADANRARRVGYDVFLASTLDGPLGIAAALHAAAILGPDRFCGLSTLDRFDRPVPPSLEITAGAVVPPPGPGLGDGLLDWYRHAPRATRRAPR